MGKEILDIINDFSQWKGNTFALAGLLIEKQKELDRQKLLEAGYPEASEVI